MYCYYPMCLQIGERKGVAGSREARPSFFSQTRLGLNSTCTISYLYDLCGTWFGNVIWTVAMVIA